MANLPTLTDPSLPKLLCLDDSRDVLDIVAYILREHCSVCGAENLDDAKRLMKEANFDLWILDYYLHDRSIFEFLCDLVSQVSPKRIAVMSGHFGNGMALRIRALGIFEQLEKPFPPDALRRMVRRMLHAVSQLPSPPSPDGSSGFGPRC